MYLHEALRGHIRLRLHPAATYMQPGGSIMGTNAELEKVYFDTMLYIYEYIEENAESGCAFARIKDGGFLLKVSVLNRIEMHGYMAKHLPNFQKIDPLQVPEVVNDGFDKIMGQINERGAVCETSLEGIDAYAMLDATLEAHRLSRRYFYEHGKIADSMDMLHLKAAENMGCSKFVTKDRALLSLRGHGLFPNMRILSIGDFCNQRGR
ncbi:hypothetical protein CENSYa_0773 [Cenarchaeum symbiosum A]|uniref:PIN domain-containing protein n=1 Tax=Cenarchaeum symbiosum (strain A) TaxID=414004 RepID=A0RVN9_CENSY|nr:hypothetical protein CENSYa_0773 [Cenarchaeum symbiosum A]